LELSHLIDYQTDIYLNKLNIIIMIPHQFKFLIEIKYSRLNIKYFLQSC